MCFSEEQRAECREAAKALIISIKVDFYNKGQALIDAGVPDSSDVMQDIMKVGVGLQLILLEMEANDLIDETMDEVWDSQGD